MQLKTCGLLYLINESIPDCSTVINGREQREVHSLELLLSKNEFPSTGTGPQSLSHSPQSTVHSPFLLTVHIVVLRLGESAGDIAIAVSHQPALGL